MTASKQKQLNIRSDEAARIASSLAHRLGRTSTDVVVDALRAYERAVEPRDEVRLTAQQRTSQDHLRALAQAIRPHVPPDLTSDHSWLYDEHGLPK